MLTCHLVVKMHEVDIVEFKLENHNFVEVKLAVLQIASAEFNWGVWPVFSNANGLFSISFNEV